MGYYISDEDARILREMLAKLKNLRAGPGILISNTPEGVVISAARQPQQAATAVTAGDSNRMAVVQLTAAATGSGIYGCVTLSPKAGDISTTDDLTPDVLFDTPPASADGYFYNLIEMDAIGSRPPSHELPYGLGATYPYYLAYWLTTNSDGKRIYVNAGVFPGCSA